MSFSKHKVKQVNHKRCKEQSITELSLRVIPESSNPADHLPVIVAKGKSVGPVILITSTIHGNEINGIKVIHDLMDTLKQNLANMSGTVIAVPVLNLTGLQSCQRDHEKGIDLNRTLLEELDDETPTELVTCIQTNLLRNVDYLLDIHTASFGKENCYYVRVDTQNQSALELAKLLDADIILHTLNKPVGTLRVWAQSVGITAVTLEVGEPQRFQQPYVDRAKQGILNILSSLKLLSSNIASELSSDTILCMSSKWIRSSYYGVNQIIPELTDKVTADELIAVQKNLFGQVLHETTAPFSGVVIGKASNPVIKPGSRLVHLGVPTV